MKIHYKMPDGQEMVEEYSPETNVLLRRAWRKQGLKEESHWEVELGDAEPQFQKLETIGIVESNSSVSNFQLLIGFKQSSLPNMFHAFRAQISMKACQFPRNYGNLWNFY